MVRAVNPTWETERADDAGAGLSIDDFYGPNPPTPEEINPPPGDTKSDHANNRTVDRKTKPRNGRGIMGRAAALAARARNLSYSDLKELQRAVAAELDARETTGRATAKPRPVAANLKAAARELAATKRGPRVKPNPRLPAKAPEIYKERVRREELGGRKENIIQFVERVYAPWRKILARADLRRLDETADAAVERWISRKRPLPEGLLLTEYELARSNETRL